MGCALSTWEVFAVLKWAGKVVVFIPYSVVPSAKNTEFCNHFHLMHPIQANGYDIHFGEHGYEALNQLLRDGNFTTLFVLVDSNTNEHCLPYFLSLVETELAIEIIEFDAGEDVKNIDSCIEIWNVLTELGADRKSLILNVGGGVVTDMGGFAAATFKRGIPFVNVPTSLLAMVDASVGGKTGIDLGPLKNQIGVIATPVMVLIDTVFLDTLPQREMLAGLAEMLKHGLIADKSYWEKFLDLKNLDSADLGGLIYESIVIKNQIVLQDPGEQNVRKALNFGHTLGHAIESLFLENPDRGLVLHGEAVAAGMLMESHLSMSMRLLSAEEYFQIRYVIKELYEDVPLDENDLGRLIGFMAHDKKSEQGTPRFTLLRGIGQFEINQIADNERIMNAIRSYRP